MDGENNGQPYFLMDDLVGFPIIFGSTPTSSHLPPNKEPRRTGLALLLLATMAP